MKQTGFTLIELLIAFAISTIVAVGTVTLFRTSIDAKEAIIEQSDYTSQMTRALRVIEQDVTQWAPYRPVRDAYGEYQASILLNHDGLFFTRTGWASSQFLNYQRSTLQRVRYWRALPGSEYCPLLDDEQENQAGGCLLRGYTAHLDDDGSFTWQVHELLRPVKNLQWEFLVEDTDESDTRWQDEPPTEKPQTGTVDDRLLAVKLILDLGNDWHYERVLITPALPPSASSGGNS